MTRKLFYEDAYLREFCARIIHIQDIDGMKGVVLDQTAFYPEGGGQPGDTGTLHGHPVVDTREIDGEIVHILASLPEGFRVGETVSGKLDWPRRFDFMQHHTGQHLLSQGFLQVLGTEYETGSIHFGEGSFSLDLTVPDLQEADANRVEDFVNDIIFGNRPVVVHEITRQDQLDKFPLRSPPKVPPGKTIRIVEIEGLDYSPCGGTHVQATGEIGLCKILKWGKERKNTRVEFACGRRALVDYRMKHINLTTIAQALSTHETTVPTIVENLIAENKIKKRQMREFKTKLVPVEAADLLQAAHQAKGVFVVEQIFPDRDPGDLKPLAAALVREKPVVVLLATTQDEKATLVFARSEDTRLSSLHLGNLLRETCARLKGGGGGKPTFAQGGGQAEGLQAALDLAFKHVIDALDS